MIEPTTPAQTLTVREYFAIQLLASMDVYSVPLAVAVADKLIDKLNETSVPYTG